MASFSSTVCGYPANTVFDCKSPTSTVSPSFGSLFNYRHVNSGTPISVVTTVGIFTCLVNLVSEPVDTVYDVKLGRDWFNYCTTAVPDAQMLLSDNTALVFSSSPFSAVRPHHAAPIPPVCDLKDQHTSDIFMSSPLSALHTCQCRHAEPKHPHCQSDDHEMSDISDPPLPHDSDVAGPGAILNDDSIDSDVAGPGAISNDDMIDVDVADSRTTLNYESVHVDVNVPSANENIRHDSRLSIQAVRSPAIALSRLFSTIEYANKPMLLDLVNLHNVQLPSKYSKDILRVLIASHLSLGECAESAADGCTQLVSSFCVKSNISVVFTKLNFQIQVLSSILYLIRQRPLRQILLCLHVSVESDMSFSKLRSELRKCITRLKHAKRSEDARNLVIAQDEKLKLEKEQICQKWPQLVSDTLKKKIVKAFHEKTSSEALATFTCASCSSLTVNIECKIVSLSNVNIDLLKSSYEFPSRMPMPCKDDISLVNCLIDPEGIKQDDKGHTLLKLCKICHSSLRHEKTPPLSLANGTYLGPVPSELSDLTPIEEAMIARCRAKAWIVQLKEENSSVIMPETQRAVRGHIIIYPQRPSEIAKVLPPSINDLLTPICVLFVGANPPTLEWLREKAKPLCIRREKVRNALKWLKENNPLYFDIDINNDFLNSLDDNHILPYHIEHVLPSNKIETLVSRYDEDTNLYPDYTVSEHGLNVNEIPFQNVVITDVDGHAPSHELRAAALRHVKQGGGYIQIPHDPTPVNEFCNPSLFPMIYPTLFPYGVGGFEDKKRQVAISMRRHVKHLCGLADRRFQEHYSFMFTAFNILQRRAVLLHTSLKVHKANFNSVASDFASVSPETVHIVTERISRGDSITAKSPEEQKVMNLMKQVNIVTSNVPGTSASRVTMRNEIRGLMIEKGMPSFFITINPADIYNPIVKFLAGAEIDLNNILPEQVPNHREQAILVAKNPFIAAKFFNIYLKAFISAVLGYDPEENNIDGGILGLVKAYYGCVEAQGRGTLHCHMMIWLEGGLNPNEIKERVIDKGDMDFRDRLIQFLDDSISNSIPDDPDENISIPSSTYHPCSVRGPNCTASEEDNRKLQQKDLHYLAKKCQSHQHSKTCFKYWKGPPHPKECRFGLDESNTCLQTSFDLDTGELCFRCLDGLVNNFNKTILECIRCNMDIKFIGSGPAAKAIIYYITNYITKSQLKTHVAFAALELSVKKLGEFDPTEDELTVRAKRLLQKCAYAMISHQELSAQQVASYLMDYEDHFTSHKYHNLYWTSFESFINKQDPSPECYQQQNTTLLNDDSNLDNDNIDILDQDLHTTSDITNLDINESNETLAQDSFEEVRISAPSANELVAKSSQVMDYQLRPSIFNNICVWDFITSFDKKRLIRKEKNKNMQMNTDDDDCSDDDSTNNMNINRFLEGHLEHNSHHLVSRKSKKLVVVPIGPSLPRRDHSETYAKYCRLMLILFKPWRNAADLRNQGETWLAAFENFKHLCSSNIITLMNNMQLLHECKENGHDHFERLKRCRQIPLNYKRPTTTSTNDDFDHQDHEAILEHLESISSCNSQNVARSLNNVLDCVVSAEASGMYDNPNFSNISLSNVALTDTSTLIDLEEIQNQDFGLEERWKFEYELRRDKWKQHTSINIQLEQAGPIDHFMESSVVSDGSQLRQALHSNTKSIPIIAQDIPSIISENKVDLDTIIKDYTLNTEQARAFKLVCHQSLNRQNEPLRMYLGGAGGTGKSRVIHALKHFFVCRGQQRRLRLTSFTGVAAQNISGMTIHAALNLNQFKKDGPNSKTLHDVQAMWEGVDFLFIDEVSMIGCKLLHQISEALIQAKGNNSPFGGINVIFAGDFAQLPPVGETRLSANIKTFQFSTQSNESQHNAIFYGKALWQLVDHVIILTESMRQTGPENIPFVDLLSRLREGRCTQNDYSMLSSRILQNNQVNWDTWSETPIIVADNAQKDALNERGAQAFANHNNRELHWYYALDTHRTLPVSQDIHNHLQNLHSGLTKQRLGKIPLVIGMPVMITHNFDVENGIVNGCTGILKSIRYTTDKMGNRYAVSCVVESPNISASTNLSMLGPNQAVVLQDTIDLVFRHPHSNKKCLIKRTQLPIAPAFAMTAHKAQGQTFNKVIVDLESCRGTESPYVMVSRVTSLNGLLILRPFKFAKIKCNQSQDTRQEFRRLNKLRLHTILKIGTSEERKEAIITLFNENTGNTEIPNTKSPDPRTLQKAQHKKITFQSRLLSGMRMEQQTSLRTDQQINTHTSPSTMSDNATTTLHARTPSSTPRTNAQQADNPKSKRRRLS